MDTPAIQRTVSAGINSAQLRNQSIMKFLKLNNFHNIPQLLQLRGDVQHKHFVLQIVNTLNVELDAPTLAPNFILVAPQMSIIVWELVSVWMDSFKQVHQILLAFLQGIATK